MSQRRHTLIGHEGKEVTFVFDDDEIVSIIDDGHVIAVDQVVSFVNSLTRLILESKKELSPAEFAEFLTYAQARFEEWQ